MVYVNGFYANTNNRSVKFAMLNDNNYCARTNIKREIIIHCIIICGND